MIEFYHKYFKPSYKTKVSQLIKDIDGLMIHEGIKLMHFNNESLPIQFKASLTAKDWIKVNNQYQTLLDNEKSLSLTLKKFINKKENHKTSEYKFIDTFSGCGGLSLGLKRVGFNPLLINEIEPKYLESYYFNHNLHIDNYHCGDIKDISSDTNLMNKDVDLVVGGPPCQGFSMANRQRLLDDPRNILYKNYLELLSNVRPKFFVMENVKGMMNKSNEILDDFHNILGDDYSIDIVLLNAKNFGIPQNRERVFVIGSRIKDAPASQIIADFIKTSENCKKFKLSDALGSLPKLKPKKVKNVRGLENSDIGYKFKEYKYQSSGYLTFINSNSKTNYLFNHTNRYNNDRDVEIFSRLPQGANSLHGSIVDIMPYSTRNHMFKDKYYKLNELEVCKTITSHMKFDCNMYIHPTQPRGLSPREAARVQTFPDDFVFMGSNNTWYAQIGNAVPVKLAEAIGKEIIKYI
jgi:DNA (cytosine-5)-methyltransferase 1